MDCDSKVSIIIPVFNVEKYIDECIESILSQKHENYEVILLDDGSSELSALICDIYVVADNRFRVIHTKNHGISAARNLAMEYMTGNYCFYLDPDDVIETDTLSYLVNLIEKTDSDMAVAVTRQFSGTYAPAEKTVIYEQIFDSREDIIEKVIFDKGDVKPLKNKNEPQRLDYEFFSTLYRKYKLKENNIRFIPISYGEDTYVCFKSLLTSKKVVTSSKTVYSHRRNFMSTTYQYHPEISKETEDYYRYYLNLFKNYADKYINQAVVGLDGQYLRRYLSAIEGEIFFSPESRKTSDKIRTIRHIRNDEKFRKLFTFESLKYTSGGLYRKLLISIKLGLYPITIRIIDGLRKRKK